jgi:UDP-N-acetylmuramoylalanine--D-glutamate ligase
MAQGVNDKILAYMKQSGSVLVLGFGKEGRSTCRFIRKHLPGMSIGIADRDPSVREAFLSEFPGAEVQFFLGEKYLDAAGQYPLVLKSPGVALSTDTPASVRNRISSQTDLLLNACHRQVIGVTGTKGKSTTSSLIHHLLRESGKDAILVGNIGLPPFDQLDRVSKHTLIVFELSSHQLEDTNHSPFIAVLTNLYPEHLDRYPGLSAYYDAKMKILGGQESGDTFIYNTDIPEISSRVALMNKDRNYFPYSSEKALEKGCFLVDDTIWLADDGKTAPYVKIKDEFHLRGKHNRMNMMAAVLAARKAGAGDEGIRSALASFQGLEHRLEYVGEFRGIQFFNDSIATIPEAAMAAVRSLPETDTMILGGYDRGLEYGPLVDFLIDSGVRNLIFLGEAGRRMHELFMSKNDLRQNLFRVSDMEEAFEVIKKVTQPGKICLLSPAAASYDIFRNFEERGSVFKKKARSL